VKEVKLRQRSLLDEGPIESLPIEVEQKAYELLVQLLVAIIPAIEGGRRDEQDHQ
jgi:hypothetical protein